MALIEDQVLSYKPSPLPQRGLQQQLNYTPKDNN